MIESIKSTPIESITVQSTQPRQTPPDASAKFGQVLKQSAMVMLGAASSVASVLPAGGILSAAIRGGAEAAAAPTLGAGQDPKSPASALAAGAGGSELDEMKLLQQEGIESSMEVLKIQQAISKENRVFSTLSNVLKARHETARTAINNIR
jgi:hypothetical protein